MVAKKEKSQHFVELKDGTTINEYCHKNFDNLVANQEALWDVIDVVSRLTRLEVKRNEEGYIVDVELILPKCDDVITGLAINNFMDYFKAQIENGMNLEELLILRRNSLERQIRNLDKGVYDELAD
jgi:hypothetical protein